MANEQHLSIIMQGSWAWYEWRQQHPEIVPDLRQAFLNATAIEGTPLGNVKFSGAQLSRVNLSSALLQRIVLNNASLFGANFARSQLQGADLTGADLQLAILKGSNLSNASLFGVDLSFADLTEADLTGAYLEKANLSGANLQGANLRGASIAGTIFNGTNLNEAHFEEAQLGWATFANVDLQRTYGLENVLHAGPSTIGLDTIVRSRGNIPVAFLQGAGLHQAQIEILQAQARNTAETMTCSIGYSLADQPLAEQLLADLRALDIPCWRVPHYHENDDRPPGAFNYNMATSFVHRYDRLVQIFSSDTLRVDDDFKHSDDIYDEVETALKQEEERQQQVLFPLYVDDAILTTDKPWAIALRQSRPVLDFTHWQDSWHYQAAFARLLRQLRGEEK